MQLIVISILAILKTSNHAASCSMPSLSLAPQPYENALISPRSPFANKLAIPSPTRAIPAN